MEGKGDQKTEVEPDESAHEKAYQTMMMMPVQINPTLSGVLAFVYWAHLQEASKESFARAEAEARGDLAEQRETKWEAQKEAREKEREEIAWAKSAQQPHFGKNVVVTNSGH